MAFDHVACMQIRLELNIPLLFFMVVLHIHFTASHCPPCKVNDSNLVTLGALDKLRR